MVPPSNRDGLRKAVIIALYPVVWVLAHKAAVAMNVGPGVSIWYPPAGLTFAFLLRFPRFWPLAYAGIGTVVLLGRGGPGNSDKVLSYRLLRAMTFDNGQSYEEALQR